MKKRELTALVLLLAGCAGMSPEQRDAAFRDRAAQEGNRICELPKAEREAQLVKLETVSGTVLYCGKD